MLDRSIAPASVAVDGVNLVEAVPRHLHNGIRAHFIGAGSQPVLRLELIFRAGKLNEKQPGVSYFTGKILLEGTNSKSSGEISDFFDSLGAFVEVTPGFDFITVTIHLLHKHLEAILPVVAELLYQPLFGEQELLKLKQIQKQRLSVDLEKNNFVASRKFREVIFGTQHPYGKSMDFPDIDDLQISWLQEHFKEKMYGNYEIILSGQAGENEWQIVNQHLGSLPTTAGNSIRNYTYKYNRQEYLEEKESSLQSTLRLGMPTLARSHPDYFNLVVANEILGGYFGSRLMKNIREDKGYTYGVHSALSHLQQGSLFLIGTEVKKAQRESTIQEIRLEIEKLQRELVPPEELETVTGYIAGSFASEVDTPFALADKFKTIYFNGLDYSYYQKFFKTLKEIDSETVLRTCGQYLKTDELSQIIVG